MRFLSCLLKEPRYLATFFSLLLSVIVFAQQQPLNLDGIVYLNTAETLLKQGFKAASAIYAWPFYPALIAAVSFTFHLPLLASAYLLNTVFATLIVFTFVTLCKELGASRKAQYLAALVILLYPYLNHFRDEVIRDYGYYAFALLSLLQLIYFLRTEKWRYALTWGLTISIASLFRVEGVIIQCFVPFMVFIPWIKSNFSRIRLYWQLNALNFLLLTLAVSWMIVSQRHINDLGRLKEFFNVSSVFLVAIHSKLTLLREHLFFVYGEKAIPSFFAGGVFALFIYSFIHTCGILYTLLAGLAWRYKLMPASLTNQLAIVTYVIINSAILLIFAIHQLFLTERYVALLCLLVMLYVPFALEHLPQWLPRANKKWLLTLVAVWLIILGIDSTLHPGPSKAYLVAAGDWVAHHTATNSRIYTNDAQLLFHSKRQGLKYPEDFTEGKVPFSTLVKQPWQDYDYLALVISRKQNDETHKILALLKGPPLCTYINNRGDKAMVFKVQKSNKSHV